MNYGLTCTSETVRWQVSCHHQESGLGPSTKPTSVSSPAVPDTASLPLSHVTPSEDVATPAGQEGPRLSQA